MAVGYSIGRTVAVGVGDGVLLGVGDGIGVAVGSMEISGTGTACICAPVNTVVDVTGVTNASAALVASMSASVVKAIAMLVA